MQTRVLPLLLLLPLLGCQSISSDVSSFKSRHFDLIAIDAGLYACIHKQGGHAIGNAGIIDLGDQTIIFDAFLSPTAALDLVEAVNHFGLSPITMVINSHHHNDHIRGNQVFHRDTRIVSTKHTADQIQQNESSQLQSESKFAPVQFATYDSLLQQYNGDTFDFQYREWKLWKDYYDVLIKTNKSIQTRVPDTFISEPLEIHGPHRSIIIREIGHGHTGSDITLYLPDEKVLFSGDLVFNQYHPYLAEGSLKGWHKCLELLQLFEINTLIPGHGPVTDQTAIDTMTSYLEMIEQEARKMALNKLLPQEISIPTKWKYWHLQPFFEANLSAVSNSLNQEQE